MEMEKPVLVFDLDETLIESEKVYDVSIPGYILTGIKVNKKLLEIIHTAKVKGCQVLLLTNNENAKVTFNEVEGRFVDISIAELTRVYNETYTPIVNLFDAILTAERSRHNGNRLENTSNSVKRTYLKNRIDIHYKDKNGKNQIRYYAKPVKSLKDVQSMLRSIKDTRTLNPSDIYFFDDDSEHQLCRESNFIHITPPFGKGEDTTDYTAIEKKLEEFSNAKGGRRTRRRRGSKGRKLKELRHGM